MDDAKNSAFGAEKLFELLWSSVSEELVTVGKDMVDTRSLYAGEDL